MPVGVGPSGLRLKLPAVWPALGCPDRVMGWWYCIGHSCGYPRRAGSQGQPGAGREALIFFCITGDIAGGDKYQQRTIRMTGELSSTQLGKRRQRNALQKSSCKSQAQGMRPSFKAQNNLGIRRMLQPYCIATSGVEKRTFNEHQRTKN